MDEHKEGSQTSDGLSAREIDEREALLITNRIGEKFGISEDDAAGWRRIVEHLMVVREIRSIAEVGFLGEWELPPLPPLEEIIPPRQLQESLDLQKTVFDLMEATGRPERFERALTILLASKEIRDEVRREPAVPRQKIGRSAKELLELKKEFEAYEEKERKRLKGSDFKRTKTDNVKSFLKSKRNGRYEAGKGVKYLLDLLQKAEKVKTYKINGADVPMTEEDYFIHRLASMEDKVDRIDRNTRRFSLSIPEELIEKRRKRQRLLNKIEDRPTRELQRARKEDRNELKRRHAQLLATADRLANRESDLKQLPPASPASHPAYPNLTDEDECLLTARRTNRTKSHRIFRQLAKSRPKF